MITLVSLFGPSERNQHGGWGGGRGGQGCGNNVVGLKEVSFHTDKHVTARPRLKALVRGPAPTSAPSPREPHLPGNEV